MRREICAPRSDWQKRCEAIGFAFHTPEGVTYWDESVRYAFTSAQIDKLYDASVELQVRCREAVEHVIENRLLDRFAIPAAFHELVCLSWRSRRPSLYGRFDFSWNGEGEPKLLEYNADTPTTVYETAAVQWQWLEDVLGGKDRGYDQFNSVHERLIERWAEMSAGHDMRIPLHFTCLKSSQEDAATIDYLRDCAEQAGFRTKPLFVEDIGLDGFRFVDLEGETIRSLFKLYPWEWLVRDEWAEKLLSLAAPEIVEPAWKMLLSNKAILPILWELFPGHPNLLPTFFTPEPLGGRYAKKPIYSREGQNVTLVDGDKITGTEGSYGDEGFVYQALAPLPEFDGNYPMIGSWMVGDESCGIGIREDTQPITRNGSRFVPHYFS